MILHPGERLGAAELGPLLAPGEREEEEPTRLRRALEQSGGDKRRAAAQLGWSYRTLLRKVREHDLAGFPKYRS